MSHTNTTPNYGLPQFTGDNVLNPLTDLNGAFEDIDEAMYNIAEVAGSATTDVGEIKTRLDAVEATAGNLVTQNGDNILVTTAQTLSGAVNELDSDIVAINNTLGTAVNNISTLATKVGNIETQNGTAVLTTTAQTLSGAINELDSNVDSNISNISAIDAKVGDETLETTAQSLSGAVNELKDAIDAIPSATIDTTMSDSSTNAVQNKVIKSYVDDNVAKIEKQNGTLTAGETSIAFTFVEQEIGTSTFVSVGCDAFGVYPTNVAVAGNVVTVTYEAQDNDIVVGCVVIN